MTKSKLTLWMYEPRVKPHHGLHSRPCHRLVSYSNLVAPESQSRGDMYEDIDACFGFDFRARLPLVQPLGNTKWINIGYLVVIIAIMAATFVVAQCNIIFIPSTLNEVINKCTLEVVALSLHGREWNTSKKTQNMNNPFQPVRHNRVYCAAESV